MSIDPLSLLGRSVFEPDVIAYLDARGVSRADDVDRITVRDAVLSVLGPEEVAKLDLDALSRADEVLEHPYASYGAKGENGFVLSAESAKLYVADVGMPRSRVSGDDNEFIVKRIDYYDKDCAFKGSKAYSGALPFGLVFGDDEDAIARKLGSKPINKGRSSYLPGYSPLAFVWTYWVEDVRVTLSLTERKTLAAAYFAPLAAYEVQVRERKRSLTAEDKNIDPSSVAAIERLRASFPTARWRKSMLEGDLLFTSKGIEQVDVLLNAYVNELKASAQKRSAASIYEATERLVRGLNAVNEQYKFIETLERDELCMLIDRLIRTTGFQLKEGEDITLLWRRW